MHLAALSTEDTDLVRAVGQLADSLQPDVLDALLRHPVRAGREHLALSSSSPALLHELAQDGDHRVRLHVAMSDACPLALLRTLADDPRKEVRQVVAASPRLPRDVVDTLVLDRSADVRWNVVSTWEHDREICRALVDDPDDIVRTHARVALGMPVRRAVHLVRGRGDRTDAGGVTSSISVAQGQSPRR